MQDPEIDMGCFVVPAAHADELRALRAATLESLVQGAPDRSWQLNQNFVRARELAAVSCIRAGLPRWKPMLYFYEWLSHLSEGSDAMDVYPLNHLPRLTTHIREYGRRESPVGFATGRGWNKDERGAELLRCMFDDFARLLDAVPPGPHVLVTAYFIPRYAERDAGVEPLAATPEDWAKSDEWWDRIIRNSWRVRKRGWTTRTFEGRVLLGSLSAEDGARWFEAYRAAYAKRVEIGRVAWYTSMRRFIDQLEPALEDAHIESRAGMVLALDRHLKIRLPWSKREELDGMIPPDKLAEVAQELDALVAEHGGTDEFVRWTAKQQRYWRRTTPGIALALVRERMTLAMRRGGWLVWLWDFFDWPGQER